MIHTAKWPNAARPDTVRCRQVVRYLEWPGGNDSGRVTTPYYAQYICSLLYTHLLCQNA
jgi:hypothetical protein